MNRSNPDIQKKPGPIADGQNSEGAGPPQEQNRTCDTELCVLRTCSFCQLTEDPSTAGRRPQSSLCRSLQKAELLLRNTFSPSLKWLLHDPSQDEEENFVLAHNLVSRSSVRLQRLQVALLTLAPQWQLVGGAQMGPPQACGRRPSSEGVVFHLLPFCHLSDRYSALWKLLEQRELLLFVHEYTRRLRLMTAYTSRVQRLLEPQTQELNLTPNQNSPDSAPSWVGLCSLSQELRIHLSHWACLSSRIQSSDCLRRAMARHSRMLQAVKESLDLLGLQALLVIERDERGENVESRRARRCGSRWPHSVQWLDLSGPLLLTDLLGRYRSLLWFFCRRVLWLKLHVPGDAPEGSLNLYDDLTTFMVLERISKAVDTGLLPDEYQAMLEELGLHVKVLCSHAHWDQGVCRTLCSSLRDKCVVPHESGVPPSVDRRNLSQTMESFLQLPPSLLWSLHSPQSGLQVSGAANLNPHMSDLQSRTVSMVLASVQLSTVWVVSKAFQFLSSWSLHKFLLITQGDLEMLMESVEEMMRQLLRLDVNRQPSICSLQLGQQLVALKEAASELQVFSSLVLKTFSVACKQMSEEIFEQNMPSAGHWRSSKLTGFPSNPSTYAALAAQTVIGQVLEGVAQLPDEARVRALSVTMTAFMEAWMEHILKERIKFSVQGALQLKRDFDSVRLMVQSECYGLSAELLQKLLSLRVFQQVDSVVLCLLQQPQDRSSLKSSTWEPLIRCCPTSSRDSMDAAAAGHITNLGFLDGEEPNQSDAPVLNSDLLAVDPPTPAEPYLAPSTVLGPAQQDWLDLRIQSGARRWRLPGLQCLSKAEL
ncbi:coiled-coil domain-containing protein 142 isoform X3 [Oryzias latipes]